MIQPRIRRHLSLAESPPRRGGVWLRDVGFWVDGAITKLTTNERAGCMCMEENDQILVFLDGRRRLVVAAGARGNGTTSSAWVARVGKQHWISSRSARAKVLSCYMTARG